MYTRATLVVDLGRGEEFKPPTLGLCIILFMASKPPGIDSGKWIVTNPLLLIHVCPPLRILIQRELRRKRRMLTWIGDPTSCCCISINSVVWSCPVANGVCSVQPFTTSSLHYTHTHTHTHIWILPFWCVHICLAKTALGNPFLHCCLCQKWLRNTCVWWYAIISLQYTHTWKWNGSSHMMCSCTQWLGAQVDSITYDVFMYSMAWCTSR